MRSTRYAAAAILALRPCGEDGTAPWPHCWDAVDFPLRKPQILDLARSGPRVRAQVRAAPWIARREPHDGGEKGGKGGEKGGVEVMYRQPVATSPTPFLRRSPRYPYRDLCTTSTTPKRGMEGGEGGR